MEGIVYGKLTAVNENVFKLTAVNVNAKAIVFRANSDYAESIKPNGFLE